MLRLKFLFLSLVVLLGFCSSAFSVVPAMISYQGKLLQPSGAPVADGVHNMQFAIYNVANGGDSLWSSISYQGTEPTTDFIQTIPAHTNAPYWIAVGTPFPKAVMASDVRFKDVAKRGDNWLTWEDAYSSANNSLRIVDSSMQGWDNTQSSFVRLAPPDFASTSDKTQFDHWWGYWMLVMDGNEIQIQFPKPVQ